MENKIFVFDIDGTLLPSNGEFSKKTINYLRNLEDKNNLVVLASGRGYHDLILLHQKLGLKSPMISSNGATLTFFDNHHNVTMSIRDDIIKDLFNNFKEIIISSYYSYLNKLFIYNKMDKLSFLYKIKADSIIIEGAFNEITLENPNSIYFILDNCKKEIFFNYINDRYSNEINITEYGHDAKYSITILDLKNTNKAYAILEMLMILNKKESDTIIFGDNYQDINMLKLEGITVSMINGTIEAKNTAKYITFKDNNNDGVVDFIDYLEQKGLI